MSQSIFGQQTVKLFYLYQSLTDAAEVYLNFVYIKNNCRCFMTEMPPAGTIYYYTLH